MSGRFPRIASLRTPAGLRARLAELSLALPCDDEVLAESSPLAKPLDLGPTPSGVARVHNRFVIQPMEGWDATPEGQPSELTERRWRNFGASGAAWIWGGEAVAVRADARANSKQLVMTPENAPAIGRLRESLLEAAREAGHPPPLVGLQLTHSGRWSIPERGQRNPRVAYRHPLLDARAEVRSDAPVLADDELPALIADFARAARLAADQGFAFVDVKHCHGYLLHEFLSARTRRGAYGGDTLAGRTRLLDEILHAVREAAPELSIGMRLSVFDGLPYRPGRDAGAPGEPEPHPLPYPHGFGLDPDAPDRIDLAEPVALVKKLLAQQLRWINVTAASPYYVPHLQRPALFPPSDGYPPPEDPLCGVVRLLEAARDIKAAAPEAIVVASGVTYLQDFLPHVAQACVREGWFDAVGLGRMALSYPTLPADVLAGRPLARKLLCRTFSDCTSAPRNGMVSGCYPLDPFYRERPERDRLEAVKRGA